MDLATKTWTKALNDGVEKTKLYPQCTECEKSITTEEELYNEKFGGILLVRVCKDCYKTE